MNSSIEEERIHSAEGEGSRRIRESFKVGGLKEGAGV